MTIVALLMAGFFAGVAAERVRAHILRQAWRTRNRGRQERSRSAVVSLNGYTAAPRKADAADQLRVVMGAHFRMQPLLNRSEARVFKELDRMVVDCNPGWQVMAQVSLGEILRCRDAEAYSCINAKRVDLLLVDENCRPRHVVEYQGGGHHQGTAAARDAVKKEALRRAGISYHEVVGGQTTPSELRRLVERLVDKPTPTQPSITFGRQVQNVKIVASTDTRN